MKAKFFDVVISTNSKATDGLLAATVRHFNSLEEYEQRSHNMFCKDIYENSFTVTHTFFEALYAAGVISQEAYNKLSEHMYMRFKADAVTGFHSELTPKEFQAFSEHKKIVPGKVLQGTAIFHKVTDSDKVVTYYYADRINVIYEQEE